MMKKFIPFWNMEDGLPSDIAASVYRKYDAESVFDLKECYYADVLADLAMIAEDLA